ncbi:MAG: cytochrome c biogenesis protein CcsA [Muribaculaceae bacterium]|nr:cytochrome c biogenesis protein CcsA [Muribaculaceae bacterium]
MRPFLPLYILLAAVLAVSTFLPFSVYGEYWFISLWGILGLSLAAVMLKRKLWRTPGSFILHLSFLMMLAGGFCTFISKESGLLHISPGEKKVSFISETTKRTVRLPEAITLLRFETDYYPGGEIPRDYRSILLVGGDTASISMNHILNIQGYRLIQNSYDSEGGTVLSVSHDPVGIFLSYAGYLLFAIGGLWLLLSRKGRFRSLLRGAAVAFILLSFSPLQAEVAKVAGITSEMADSLAREQVIYGGRIVTFDTQARDILRKIYGKPSYRGLSSGQTIASFMLYPAEWKNLPLIKIKEKSLRKALKIKGEYASLSDLFDREGNYLVDKLRDNDYVKGVDELDEKAGLLLELTMGSLVQPVVSPAEKMPEWRVNLELIYNRIPFTLILFILPFISACILFLALTIGTAKLTRSLIPVGNVIARLALSISILNFGLTWLLTERIPVANTFETLEFAELILLGLLAAGSGFINGRKGKESVMSIGLIMAGAIGLVSHLLAGNPIVTPLMPVLHSPWLSLHVTLVMTSYALLGMASLNSVISLFRQGYGDELRRLNLILLYPGVWLLGCGIFTGAVWANVSWGSYWSWDPKETWALITFMIYALPLHRNIFREKDRKGTRNFHIYLLCSLLTILMTYFGVNHLNSMHGYS